MNENEEAVSDQAMLDEPMEFSFGELNIDVNWTQSASPCKMIRFRLGGKEVVVPRNDFYSMLIMFSGPKQLDNLIPVKETKVRMITRVLKVQANKDMKKGETLVFPYTYPVDAEHYNKLLLSPEFRSADIKPHKSLEGIVNKMH